MIFAFFLAASDLILDHATVVSTAAAGSVEGNVAALLAERLHEQTGVPAEVVPEVPAGAQEKGLVVLLHTPRLRAFLEGQHVAPPTPQDPGP